MHIEIHAADTTDHPDQRTSPEQWTVYLVDRGKKGVYRETEPSSLSAVLDWLIQSQWMHVITDNVSLADLEKESTSESR